MNEILFEYEGLQFMQSLVGKEWILITKPIDPQGYFKEIYVTYNLKNDKIRLDKNSYCSEFNFDVFKQITKAIIIYKEKLKNGARD